MGGIEVFVIDGGFELGGGLLSRWDWIRLPDGEVFEATTGSKGAHVWIKTGHLRHLGDWFRDP